MPGERASPGPLGTSNPGSFRNAAAVGSIFGSPSGADGCARHFFPVLSPSHLRAANWICIVLRYICSPRDNLSARFGVYFYWMTHSIG
jgi:hypothetical protein